MRKNDDNNKDKFSPSNLLKVLNFSCKTSKVIAFIARHIIPSVTVFGAKSVNTVLVFQVVWLLWSPEPKFIFFIVCPYKRSFYTSVIESDPRFLSVMAVLNVNIFFLVVNRHQM